MRHGRRAGRAHLFPVKLLDGILGVAVVLVRDEGEPWRLPGDPDRGDLAELSEGVLDVALLDTIVYVSDINL